MANKKYMVSYKDVRKTRWDFFILLLAIFNSFQVPLIISFYKHDDSYRNSYWFILDMLIDISFLIDIVLVFLTSFANKQGQEIFDPAQIRKHKVYTFTFFTDFMSVMGNTLFQLIHPDIAILGVFKIFRVQRLSTHLARLKVPKEQMIIINFLKYAFYYLLIFHIFACYWNFIIEDHEME